MGKEDEPIEDVPKFAITDRKGNCLRIGFGYDMNIIIEGANGVNILNDFPSFINGGGRHPQTMRALYEFSKPGREKKALPKKLPIVAKTVCAQRNNLKVSVSKEGEVSVVIQGRDFRVTPNQSAEFTLFPGDPEHNLEIVWKFFALAQAIKKDEKNIESSPIW